ncbi:glycoside hydrolase [Geopyxis carbonaria]|nr:glycoside hydrolase [Geopyxis carbonaria]
MRISNVFAALLATALSVFPGPAAAAVDKQVFAHFMLGDISTSAWDTAITNASAAGISGFALNVNAGYPSPLNAIHDAYAAAERSSTPFSMFISFDFCCGDFSADTITSWLQELQDSTAQAKVDGRTFVSTFEGSSAVGVWDTVRANVGSLYVVPSFTYTGGVDAIGANLDSLDGAFNWEVWPQSTGNMTTDGDKMYQDVLQPAGKTYMMGVSPWMYANIEGTSYSKNWIRSSDTLWFDRWEQVVDLQPDLVEIITWNDFGESHYIGGLGDGTVPDEMSAYVDNCNHEAWQQPLAYYIAAYKAGTRDVPVPDKAVGAVFWYRTTPKDVCSDGGTSCGYESGIAAAECTEDNVYVLTTLNEPGTVSVKIGGQGEEFQVAKGAQLVKMPFNGRTGAVEVSVGGKSGKGPRDITNDCPLCGYVNFNPVVGKTS